MRAYLSRREAQWHRFAGRRYTVAKLHSSPDANAGGSC
jgi:hypothetical protein